VDRLGVFDDSGNIDEKHRSDRLGKWATRYWTKEMRDVYIPPNFEIVHGSSPELGQAARSSLLASQPCCLEAGLTVIYGQGGIGKTFFLSRVAHDLAAAATKAATRSIPVFVQLAGVLHRYALETWLSHNDFRMLTLAQITCLLRHGVVVPLLDALDEVVKGEARQGSEEFLDHLLGLMTPEVGGRGILACRDYYLTTDRSLVGERVRRARSAELSIGPFAEKDTQRFIQHRARLSPEHASRWADALQREAAAVVGEETELEVVRHPVVLDALARYIKELPPESRVTAAEEFRLTRGDIFGQIVDELLKRERQKLAPLWEQTFVGRLEPDWMNPFDHEKQRRVLRGLTLLVARNGDSQFVHESDWREFRHGLFLSTKGVPEAESPKKALEALVCQILGTPRVVPEVPEERRHDIQSKAIEHLAEAYAGHILANTEPERPDDLVFALRHRFYFEYFLADALLEQIERALAAGQGSEVVEWCLSHHVGGTFAGCLDFLAWDPRIGQEGAARLRDFFTSDGERDEVLASYLMALSLAVFLRRQVPGRERPIERVQFAPDPKLELLIMKEFLPNEINHLGVALCSFPSTTVDSLDLTDVHVESCDFAGLRICGTPRARITRCSLVEVECGLLSLEGTIVFADCELDIEGDILVEEGAHIEIYNCGMTDSVLRAFEEARQMGSEVVIVEPRRIEKAPAQPTRQTPGRRFVNKLMSLLRKEGHSEFGVYLYKLRDRTPGTDEDFDRALNVLKQRGCVETRGPMVFMTPAGEAEMYQPRLLGQAEYDPHDEYWEPLVRELDTIMTR
jgi:hypothetical protein